MLLEINTIYHELLTRSRVLFDLKHKIAIERLRIDRAEQIANAEMENLIETHAQHRRHLTAASNLLIEGIRRRESHDVYVGEARNDLDLILKQYDMKALYFKTVYENEIAFFVSQKMRLDEETAIHHEFVLTTYQNQMRFAEEQIKLANAEYRTRMESFLKVIEEQRSYHQSILENHYNQYISKRKRIDEDYQATLYATSHLLSEAEDKKQKLALQKNVDYSKSEYEKKIVSLEKSYHEHPVVVQSNTKLAKLDQSIEQALDDAETMLEHTVSEYSELYHKAKERYDTLKPYFDKNINVMDPVFVDQIERIKLRFEGAKKDAEAELELLSKPLIDHYLQVYFAEADEPDLKEYKQRIQLFETEKAALSKQLQSRLDQIETEFAGKVKETNQILQTQLSEITPMTTLIDQKAKTIESEYLHLLQLQKKEKIDARNRLSTNAAFTIETLTAEYHKALKSHAAMASRMTDQFAKLVDAYQPYIRLAKKTTKFPRHLAIVKARHRRLVRADLNALAKRYRSYRIPTTKL
ncbi:MAG: hypothetical protein MZU97_25395 [Bacillus subtilis]|nr:hypothetical protein [Bacillus subtilis]